MKQPIRAALYARVSTADQQTLPLQIADMRKYAEQRGWTVVKEAEDINGGTKLRPKREELLQMARRGQLNVIVVWRLDRWGRSLSDVIYSLEELRAINVAFASVYDQLDFSTPGGRAMSHMLGVFAEFERDILRARVCAGLEHARQKGQILGRPATAMAKVDKIRELSAQGLNKIAIADRLKIGRASVYRALEKAL
jgi:putative DNA-invertase from lambdoid prophage Rac